MALDKRFDAGSLIEEEMTFEELSSKLGGLVFDEQPNGQDLIFNDLASSARISICTPLESSNVSKNISLDCSTL
jgi:hypothetical protein